MSQSNKVNSYPGQIIIGGQFTIDSAGMNSTGAINLGNDTNTGAINIGTGALARTVTIGNETGATALVLNAGTGGIAVPGDVVTQATSVTTGVTLSENSGVITTFSQSAAAGVSAAFTVTNTIVAATDKIVANIVDYAGTYTTNGVPVVSVDNIGAGSFDLVVSNAHGANALSGAVQIAFVVLK